MCNGASFDLDGVVLDSMSIWNDLGRGICAALALHRSRA